MNYRLLKQIRILAQLTEHTKSKHNIDYRLQRTQRLSKKQTYQAVYTQLHRTV